MEGAIAGIVGVLVGVAVTWGLNQMSALLRDRQERRKPIGRALADLLELRMQAFALRRFLQLCVAEYKLPHDALTEDSALAALTGPGLLLGDTEELTKRYNAAVDLVAEVDPVLAFRMRSKDRLPWFLAQMQAMLPRDVLTAHGLPNLPEEIGSELEDQFDEFVLELARLHSWRAARQVKRRLQLPVEIPPELREMLDRFFAAARSVHTDSAQLSTVFPPEEPAQRRIPAKELP